MNKSSKVMHRGKVPKSVCVCLHFNRTAPSCWHTYALTDDMINENITLTIILFRNKSTELVYVTLCRTVAYLLPNVNMTAAINKDIQAAKL